MSSSLTQESKNYRNICFDAVFKSEQSRSENLEQSGTKMADNKKSDLPLPEFKELAQDKVPEPHSEVISEGHGRSSLDESHLLNHHIPRDPVFADKEVRRKFSKNIIN